MSSGVKRPNKINYNIASFDFLQQSVSHFVDFTTYDTVHGEAVKNKKRIAYCNWQKTFNTLK